MINLSWTTLFAFAAHAIEELVSHFYDADTLIRAVAEHAGIARVYIFFFILIIPFLFLTAALILAMKRSVPPVVSFMILLLCFFESTHVIAAISNSSYYPGLITSVPILMLGIVWAKELWLQRNNNLT